MNGEKLSNDWTEEEALQCRGDHNSPYCDRLSEDAYQDICLKLLEKEKAGELSREVWSRPGYIKRCVRRRKIDLYRREQAHPTISLDAVQEQLTSLEGDPEELMSVAEMCQVEAEICQEFLKRAQSCLSETEYQVWRLRIVEGLSPAEVQERLQLASVACVYSRTCDARQKLRRIIEEAGARRQVYLNSGSALASNFHCHG
jgi:DNA-directed RNA polymerase specialized sigma24 family protein